MSDQIDRLRSLDEIPVPNLWPQILTRARQRTADDALPPLRHVRPRRSTALIPGSLDRRLPLVAAGLAIVLVAGALFASRPSSALALVEEARSSFAEVSPFRATISTWTSRDVIADEFPAYDGPDVVAVWLVSYADPDAWRRDVLAQEPSLPAGFGRGDAGSFEVWDGTSLGIYRAETNHFYRQPTAVGFDPLGELTWTSGEYSWNDRCADSEVLADEVIAGRPARHVRCGETELWIDAETGLMLRMTSEAFTAEITDVEYDVEFALGTFVVAAPAGASEGADATPSPVGGPATGAQPATWSGTLLGGGTFRLEELRGRPALVFFWADWCDDACASVFPAFAQVAAELGSDAHFVAVDYAGTPAQAESWLSERLGSADWSFPIVVDDGSIGQAWGIAAVPTLVALDADGRVVDVRAGAQTADELRHMLDRARP